MPPVADSVAELARTSVVRGALEWFRKERAWLNDQHLKLCRVAAPTFLEEKRANYMLDRFRELGWDAWIDRAGNVQFRGGSRNFNPAFAKAARVAIVEVDEIVEVGELPVIDADATQMRQLFQNLIGNALKFTVQGEISLTVNLGGLGVNPTPICFTVRDTGIGISSEQRPRIFEPFSQADSSTTRKYGGTGLGLTISAKLVAMMGGKLEVESQEGVGSTFFFRAGFFLDGFDGMTTSLTWRFTVVVPRLHKWESHPGR